MVSVVAPTVGRDDAFFWKGVEDGQLLAQSCEGCGVLRHPPRPMCPYCNSLEWEAVPISGRGVVHSWVIPRHPSAPPGEERIVILVELESGLRLVSNLLGVGLDEVHNEMSVEVSFERLDDVLLPLFRPVDHAEG